MATPELGDETAVPIGLSGIHPRRKQATANHKYGNGAIDIVFDERDWIRNIAVGTVRRKSLEEGRVAA